MKSLRVRCVWHEFCTRRHGAEAMEWVVEQSGSYRVEVSGWDNAENFFVEATTLRWRAGDTREISLRHKLREHSILFVQLIQPFTDRSAPPAAYQATEIGSANSNGAWWVKLEKLRPRDTYKEELLLTSAVELA